MSATTTSKTVLCGNCKGRHPSALDVKACYMGHRVAPTYEAPKMDTKTEQVFQDIANGSRLPQTNPGITEPQLSFLRKLLAERPSMAEAVPHPENLTKSDAGTMISRLKAMPKEVTTKPAGKVAKGEQVPGTDLLRGDIHVIDGCYVRVHVSQSTGRPYACVYDQVPEKFEYAPSFTSKLNAGNKATAEQAAAFGSMTGHCCFCNTAIDTPESVAVGYGPICAGKFGLPWG